MKRGTLFFTTSFFASALLPASYDISRALLELERREKTISAIQFNFEQDIFFTQMNTQSTVGGKALFAKTGKLRITKSHPDQQETVSDGKKVWVFNPAFNQVWEGSSKKWLESSVLPRGLIPLENYVADLRKNFILSMAEQVDANMIRIHAVPKNKGLGYRLELLVSSDSWLPMESVFISDSARVVTRWSEYKVNPQITEDSFHFVPPHGADVIPLN